MSSYIGIDPGITGAVAFIGPDGIQLHDTPVLTVMKAHKHRRVYAPAGMVELLMSLRAQSGPSLRAAIEKASPMPPPKSRNPNDKPQGTISMFGYGQGYGIWIGILCALGIPYDEVHPARWKKVMMDGMDKGKASSIARALQLFPTAELTRKKDHGRADALLIAEYRRRLG